MLRLLFLYLSTAQWARALVTRSSLGWLTASRFVAGETVDAAIEVIRTLNAKGINATLDHLGESVSTLAEADHATEAYLLALDKIAASKVRSNVSLKLTQFGLALDYTACLRNVRRVVEKAYATQNFVRIDMEDTPFTDQTFQLLRELRREFDNVGVVVQAYLYRTEEDLLALTAEKIRLRLCKGAYNEPPDKAFPKKADTDANYVKLANLLLDRTQTISPADASGRTPPMPGFATHDEQMIAAIKAAVVEKKTPREYFEFQMLYGIRRELQEQLAKEGYAMRVYVPYGTEWYPYFVRRLAERPANVWFFVSNFFRR